ncbi:hypothetical protein TI05_02600 [Achromatium sp. WMS3]|nr:hypothetical protein TI05_02600 [Achromatium sp. WMS3]
MDVMEEVRVKVMALSVSERASLAHDIILSLDDPDSYSLAPTQEAEIQHRIKMIQDGTASGRPAADVFAKIRAKYS